MDKYSYEELVRAINEQVRNTPDAQVTVFTLRYWVKIGLLPEPQGGSRWRYFDAHGLERAVSVRKLQVLYNQSIKSIKQLEFLVHSNSRASFPGDPDGLKKLVVALEQLSWMGFDHVPEIEAFKKGDCLLVEDKACSPPYRLSRKSQLSGSYVEENGKVYKAVESITDASGKVVYFKPSQIEKYSKLNVAVREKHEANKIRRLIDLGIMTTPRYRYEGEDYFSDPALAEYITWMDFIWDYGLSHDDLKLLRTRIECDIDSHFDACTLGHKSRTHLSYQFEKQTKFFGKYLRSFYRETKKNTRTFVFTAADKKAAKQDGLKLISDYLKGFYFLHRSFEPGSSAENIYLKTTLIDELSPAQIQLGLSQGRFSLGEVEKLLKSREAEVAALKSIVSDFSKGK